MSSSDHSQAAFQVPEHTLLHRIGIGAYGEVWLARSLLGMPRAVKVVWRHRFEHEKVYEREYVGLKNAEPISRSHGGIVDILQIGQSPEGDHFYYVMELADPVNPEALTPDLGRYEPMTLGKLLELRGALPVMECVRIGAAMADALGFLHRHGLVHRDVKPSNIIFVGGQPKLADMGLLAGLNHAGSFVGTDGYIAPEGPGSVQSDIYGLGKVLYEMVTGQNRLDFPDLPECWRNASEPPLFAELNETILKACALTLDQRHRSAGELRDELLLLEAGRSVRRMRRNERVLKTWRRLGLAAIALSTIGLAAAWASRKATEKAEERAFRESELREVIEAQALESRQALYAADINMAQKALEGGNWGRAEQLLESYIPRTSDGEGSGFPFVSGTPRPDLRGFEWYHLWHRVRGDTRQVLRGHEGLIRSLALGTHGFLYSGSFDGSVREWSLATGLPQRVWHWPDRLVHAMAFDPERATLGVELSDPSESVLIHLGQSTQKAFPSHAPPCVAFSPEGDRWLRGVGIVLFETDASLEIVEIESGRVEQTLPASGGRPWFSPDGTLLGTGPWGDMLRLWTWPGLQWLGDLEIGGTVMDADFSPDGQLLACSTRQGEIQIWNISSRTRVAATQAHGGTVIWHVAFSRDGKRLASAANDQTVQVWEPESLEQLRVFRGHGSEVWNVQWLPDGEQLISAGKDATVRIWNVNPPSVLFEPQDLEQAPVFSPDETWVALRSRSRGVQVLDLASQTVRFSLGPASEIGGFSPETGLLSLIRTGSTIEWFSMEEGNRVLRKTLPEDLGAFTSRLLSPSGRWLILARESGVVDVWDVWAGERIHSLTGHTHRVFSLKLDVAEQRLLSGARDMTARLWDMNSGAELTVLRGHQMSVSSLAFSPDPNQVATGSWDDTVRVWNLTAQQCIAVLGGHAESVHAVTFSPDGRSLAVLTGGGELRFWNLFTGRESGIFPLERGYGVGRLEFSPSGEWLAAVDARGQLTWFRGPR